jgi:O-antigen/teichoic acid export membrane protein
LAAAVGIGSSLLLIPRLGITGAGFATLLATTVLFGSGLILVRSRLDLWPYDSRYLKGFAAGILAAIAVLILRRFLDWDGAVEWIVGMSLSTAVFAFVLWRLGFDAEDQALFNWTIALLKGSESNADTAIGS